jgi:hypothetical protein
MKSLLGLLLIAAAMPLTAQTSTPHTLVFNFVVTTVTASSGQNSSGSSSGQTSGTTTGTTVTIPPDNSSTNSNTGSNSNPSTDCVSFYSDAVTAMNGVYSKLIEVQQNYTAKQQANSATTSASVAKNDSVVKMQLYSQDVRDIIRLGGPQAVVGTGVAAISTEVITLPGLLVNTSQPLVSLVSNMQTGLKNVSDLVDASTCPQSTP